MRAAIPGRTKQYPDSKQQLKQHEVAKFETGSDAFAVRRAGHMFCEVKVLCDSG
jgi:hypothetical protein